MVREIVQVSTNQGRLALPNDVAVTEQRPADRPAAPIARPGSAAVLKRLTRLHPKLIDLSLGRIERLLVRLGNPERRLPPVVHVAGTNGKGSVVAFIRAILEAAGYSVHAYTSPHLVRFNERVRLAGGDISDEALAALLEECEKVNAGEVITFFEITTAAALLAFARTPADVLLLETGLGGRLDATNVVPRPALTVLTPVSIDHQHFLGETLAEIAGEKAGIVKPGVVCVSALQEDAVADVIAGRAAALGLLTAAAASAQEAGCSEPFMARIQAEYQAIGSFSGRFAQEDRQADGSVVRAAGEIAYVRPGRMRWDYEPPHEQLVVTDGQSVWLFDPLLDNVTVQPLEDVTQGTPLAFLLGVGNLQEDFTCASVPTIV